MKMFQVGMYVPDDVTPAFVERHLNELFNGVLQPTPTTWQIAGVADVTPKKE